MKERPIKFRVWHQPTKRMYPVASFTEDSVWLPWDEAKTDTENYALVDHPFRREHCVLLQFTGLHDFFGNEIWEGDITRWSTFYEQENRYMEYHYEVVYRNGCFGMLSNEDFTPYDGERDATSDVVVGNAFEHRYLLEQSLSLVWTTP